MSVEVKICGITRSEDAETALKAGAQYLGFILYAKSPRKISITDAILISENYADFSHSKVAVDVCPDLDKVRQMKEAGFDFFQFHFPLDFETEKILQWSELVSPSKLWLAPKLPPGSAFPEQLLDLAETFVMDAFSKDQFGGTGQTSDWDSFSKYQTLYSNHKWILAGGMGPENIGYAVQHLDLGFVDVNSAVETSPGIKNKDKIKNLFLRLQELEK